MKLNEKGVIRGVLCRPRTWPGRHIAVVDPSLGGLVRLYTADRRGQQAVPLLALSFRRHVALSLYC